MSKLFQAGSNLTTTENGAVSFKSSLSAVLDLFFKAGASRGKDLTQDFEKAFAENPELTVRLGLWLRDAREGAGERQHFKNFLKWVTNKVTPEGMQAIIVKTSELGRFDDLQVLFGTRYQNAAAQYWVDCIRAGNGLAAKWAPVKDKKGAGPLRHAMGMNEASWRKFVVSLRSTVEQQMCSKNWDGIKYSQVPSVAAARYQKAFGRNDPTGYTNYINSLVKGDAKINASAIFPHDVVLASMKGNDTVASEQWKALPDFLAGSTESFLPIVDTSGSMTWPGAKVKDGIYALHIAVGLAIYFAERNKSAFKNEFLEFNDRAVAHTIKGGSLAQKIRSVTSAGVGGSTNLQAAVSWVLQTAIRNKLPQSDLPTKLLIVSDMQFNGCSRETNLEAMERKFAEAGYTMPGVIFWQVNARAGSMPVTMHNKNVALVSGYSPATIKGLMQGELDPMKSMLNVLNNERYDLQVA